MVDRQDVIKRLTQLGYEPVKDDYEQIDFELTETLDYVYNYCNISEIPPILDNRIIDRVCARYLFFKKNSGELYGFDYDLAVKEIKEGDTTLRYAVGQDGTTPENRFDSMVKTLERGFDKWITPHRRLRW